MDVNSIIELVKSVLRTDVLAAIGLKSVKPIQVEPDADTGMVLATSTDDDNGGTKAEWLSPTSDLGLLDSATAATTYLKLDASNDPLTGNLAIQKASPTLSLDAASGHAILQLDSVAGNQAYVSLELDGSAKAHLGTDGSVAYLVDQAYGQSVFEANHSTGVFDILPDDAATTTDAKVAGQTILHRGNEQHSLLQQGIDDLRDDFEAHHHDQRVTALDLVPRDLLLHQRNGIGSPIKAMSINTSEATSASSVSDGVMYMVAVYLPVAATLTGVWWIPLNTGAFTADNNNKVGLYTRSGTTFTLVASSANDGNTFKTTANTFSQKAFSSTYAATAGMYWVALLRNESAAGTTTQIYTPGGVGAAMHTLGGTAGAGLSGFVAGQTDLPATTSSMTEHTIRFLCGVY